MEAPAERETPGLWQGRRAVIDGGAAWIRFSMKTPLRLLLAFAAGALRAEPPVLPPNYPAAQYDEAKVPRYSLPDPLVLLDGTKVTDVKTWREKRRPEILRLFATDVYGRTMVGRPEGMTWATIATEPQALDGAAVRRDVTIYFVGRTDGPKMDLRVSLPARTAKPAPVFLMAGGGGPPGPFGGRGSAWEEKTSRTLIERGYGLITCDLVMVEADHRDGYAKSVRAFFAAPGQKEPGPDEWGAIGAWAWALSRAMDYLATAPDVDAGKVCVIGVSRYGKVAMWAGAQDERFAIVFSCVSGCGGATIVRRQFGETIASITNFAPYWFDRNFKSYAGRVNDLPVDWHLLIAAVAPRPIYLSTAERDYWNDQRGQFIAARNAEPVYALFGKRGLGVQEMPPVDTPVGDTIGFHLRQGSHGLNDYDWRQFLDFADRHFGRAPAPGNSN